MNNPNASLQMIINDQQILQEHQFENYFYRTRNSVYFTSHSVYLFIGYLQQRNRRKAHTILINSDGVSVHEAAETACGDSSKFHVET